VKIPRKSSGDFSFFQPLRGGLTRRKVDAICTYIVYTKKPLVEGGLFSSSCANRGAGTSLSEVFFYSFSYSFPVICL